MRRIIDRIREKVRNGQYVLTFHAIDEMAEEGIEEEGFEQAMMSGQIVRRQKVAWGDGSIPSKEQRMMKDPYEQCVDSQTKENRLWLLRYTSQPKI